MSDKPVKIYYEVFNGPTKIGPTREVSARVPYLSTRRDLQDFDDIPEYKGNAGKVLGLDDSANPQWTYIPVKELNTSIGTLNTQVKALQTKDTAVDKAIADLTKASTDGDAKLQGQITALEAKDIQLDKSVQALSKASTDGDNKLQVQVTTLQQKDTATDARITEVQQILTDLDTQTQGQVRELDTLVKANKAQDVKDKTELQGKIDGTNKTITALDVVVKANKTSTDTQIQTLTANDVKIQKRIDDMGNVSESKLKDVQTQVQTLDTRLTETGANIYDDLVQVEAKLTAVDAKTAETNAQQDTRLSNIEKDFATKAYVLAEIKKISITDIKQVKAEANLPKADTAYGDFYFITDTKEWKTSDGKVWLDVTAVVPDEVQAKFDALKADLDKKILDVSQNAKTAHESLKLDGYKGTNTELAASLNEINGVNKLDILSRSQGGEVFKPIQYKQTVFSSTDELVNKGYVDTQVKACDDRNVNKAGDTLSGSLTGPDFIQSTPQSNNAAASTRKDYVDKLIAERKADSDSIRLDVYSKSATDSMYVNKTDDTLTPAQVPNAIQMKGKGTVSYQDGVNTRFHTYSEGNTFKVSHGNDPTTNVIAVDSAGAMSVKSSITSTDFIQSTAQTNNPSASTRKDYVDAQVKAMDEKNFTLNKTPLSVDLDTLGAIANAGVYHQPANANASDANHYPMREAGSLLVVPSAYGCQQEYTSFSTNKKFIRGLTAAWNGKGPWNEWKELSALGGVGAKGDKGDTGPAGVQGPEGQRGNPGMAGLAGQAGPKGPQGDVGPAGAQGIKGDKGDTGIQGPKGVDGARGPNGAAGPQGPKGDVGIQGVQGPKGDQGDNANLADYTGSVGITASRFNVKTTTSPIRFNTDGKGSLINISTNGESSSIQISALGPKSDINISTMGNISLGGLSVDISGGPLTIKGVVVDPALMKIQDTRAAVKLPNQFQDKSVSASFTNQEMPHKGTWLSSLNVNGWSTDYNAWEIASDSSPINYDNRLFFRGGRAGTWGEYNELYHTGSQKLTVKNNDASALVFDGVSESEGWTWMKLGKSTQPQQVHLAYNTKAEDSAIANSFHIRPSGTTAASFAADSVRSHKLHYMYGDVSIADAAPYMELHQPGKVAVKWHIDTDTQVKLTQTAGNGVSNGNNILTVDWTKNTLLVDGKQWVAKNNHSYVEQYGAWAPYSVDFGAVPGASDYYQIVKGRSVANGAGYTTDAEFGMLRNGNTWGSAVIRVGSGEAGSKGTQAAYTFDTSGNFTAGALVKAGGVQAGTSGIATTGNMSINNASPTITFQDTDNLPAMLHNNSNLFYVLRGGSANASSWDTGPNGRHPMTLNLANGDVVFSGNVVAYSDRRLKRDITPIKGALDKVLQLEGVNYRRIGTDTDRLECGFIAQEVQKVIPEVIIEQPDSDKTLSMDYAKLNAYLVEAIKELTARLAVLEGRA